MTTEEQQTEGTVGDIVATENINILKMLMLFVGAVVYTAGVVYAESHGFAMLNAGVNPEYRIWAMLGMLSVGITALAMPIMIGLVINDNLQLWIALIFYFVDAVIMIANAAVNFLGNTGGQLPEWGLMYASWVLPVTPIIVAAGWAIDWLLSPEIRERIQKSSVLAAIRNIRLKSAVKHASTAAATSLIHNQAAIDADDMIAAALGQPVFRKPSRSKTIVFPAGGWSETQPLPPIHQTTATARHQPSYTTTFPDPQDGAPRVYGFDVEPPPTIKLTLELPEDAAERLRNLPPSELAKLGIAKVVGSAPLGENPSEANRP